VTLANIPSPPGEAAVRRLTALHRVYSFAGRRVLLRAGLKPGMTSVDFGCGVGATTRMLAELVGQSGHVTGIDINADQLQQGRRLCKSAENRQSRQGQFGGTAGGFPSWVRFCSGSGKPSANARDAQRAAKSLLDRRCR